nr:NlpC/P60 family protein [Nonomuraea sp. FMUSA5-5]
MAGGGQYAATAANPDRLASAVCAYVGKDPKSPLPHKHVDSVPLTSKQAANARIIIDTANALGLPRRAAVIALATALQESSLRNDTVGDRGRAFGLFQQHPEYGWGTRTQVTNQHYATQTFFSRLKKIREWETKPLTAVAQAVQRSAHPNAYAKHETRAQALISTLTRRSRQPRPPRTSDSSLKLSEKDEQAVRASLELATALGVPRETFVADVQEALNAGKLTSAHKGTRAMDPRRLAERIVTSVARRTCDDLSRKINEALDPETLATLRTSGRGGVALAAALKMLGVPYSWGGGGPDGPSYGIGRGASTKGFDCSGLAEYAWAKAGVKIGGHTSTQWHAGVHVPRAQLKPGDLLFFAKDPRNPATIHHVVINIDGKRYLHAPATGSNVQIDQWTTRRQAEYAGAVRPG